MLFFDWTKVYDSANGSISHCNMIMEMIIKKSLPKNRFDPLYKYSNINFIGRNFLIHPDMLLFNAYKYGQRDLAESTAGSIDIDGNDYHIREALSNYKPRVIIMEYNGCFNSTSEYVMGYDENYKIKLGSIKFGASLQSLVNQANRLGYDYVYSESRGSDAFFIRKDINPFPSLTSKEGWVELFWHKKLWLNKLKGISKEYEDRNL